MWSCSAPPLERKLILPKVTFFSFKKKKKVLVLRKGCVSRFPAGHQPHVSVVKTATGMHTGGVSFPPYLRDGREGTIAKELRYSSG